MSRAPGTPNSGIRWDRVMGEWRLQCQSCAAKSVASYWPLTFEFWQPAWGMNRCRACVMEAKAARNRERWRTDPKWRQAKLEENREQRRAQARFAYKERWALLRSDPEKYAAYIERRREAGRASSQRYRDRQRAA